jgi:hypothetical protein
VPHERLHLARRDTDCAKDRQSLSGNRRRCHCAVRHLRYPCASAQGHQGERSRPGNPKRPYDRHPVLGGGHQATGPTIRVSAPVNALTLAQWVRRRHSSTTSWNIHARPGSGGYISKNTITVTKRRERIDGVTRVVTPVTGSVRDCTCRYNRERSGVATSARGGRPRACRDGHVQLECNMGLARCSCRETAAPEAVRIGRLPSHLQLLREDLP